MVREGETVVEEGGGIVVIFEKERCYNFLWKTWNPRVRWREKALRVSVLLCCCLLWMADCVCSSSSVTFGFWMESKREGIPRDLLILCWQVKRENPILKSKARIFLDLFSRQICFYFFISNFPNLVCYHQCCRAE